MWIEGGCLLSFLNSPRSVNKTKGCFFSYLTTTVVGGKKLMWFLDFEVWVTHVHTHHSLYHGAKGHFVASCFSSCVVSLNFLDSGMKPAFKFHYVNLISYCALHVCNMYCEHTGAPQSISILSLLSLLKWKVQKSLWLLKNVYVSRFLYA